ncbi:hypothetical protein [Variovorax sp. GT1P44]|uniref:hypothetical protein n=1 Tax=Variovorax sp. GT1P44 TaxID=3443742 RepID=UPI003F4754F0
MKTEREAFEAHFVSKFGGYKPLTWLEAEGGPYDVPEGMQDHYYVRTTQQAWEAWQARAELASLYDRTGDIKDINTMLVPRAALSEQTPLISRREAAEIAYDAAIRYANGQVIDWGAEFSTQQGEALTAVMSLETDARMANAAIDRESAYRCGFNEAKLAAIAALSAQQAGTGEPSYTGGVLPLPKPAINISAGKWEVIADCRYFTADQMHEYAARCMLHAIPAPKAAPAAVSGLEAAYRDWRWMSCTNSQWAAFKAGAEFALSSPPSVGEPSTDGAKPAGKVLTDEHIEGLFYPMGTASEAQLLIARGVGRAIEAAALAAAPDSRSEAELLRRGVSNSQGMWRSCSGCHESNEGHPTGPHSTIFGCAMGNGCNECGGIGVVWTSDDEFQAMADFLNGDESAAPDSQGAPKPVALTDEQIAHLWAFEWKGDRVAFIRATEAAHGIVDCGEYGHDKGVCGNARCCPSSGAQAAGQAIRADQMMANCPKCGIRRAAFSAGPHCMQAGCPSTCAYATSAQPAAGQEDAS